MTHIYKTAEGERAVLERYREVLKRWPVENQQLRVPTREGETFVVASGNPSAPPLLLLHGSMSNSASWMFDVIALAPHFRVYAIDVIGEYGLSAQTRPPLSSDAYAMWLDDLLIALAIERASMVGISLGGWLALDYATRHPERIERLALLCPGGVGRQKNFRVKAIPLMMLGQWGARRVRLMVFGKAPAAIPPQLQFFVDFMALIFEHARPRREQLPIFSDDSLRRLKMPLLAIVGGKDVLIDSLHTKTRLERIVASATVRYLPKERHAIRGQTPSILEFLMHAEDVAA